MPLELLATKNDVLPIWVENISPSLLDGLSHEEIGRVAVRCGNQKTCLGEHFQISGSLDDATIEMRGDLKSVHSIGGTMSSGRMIVHGNAGRHVASKMCGGELIIDGNASDYVGSSMRGGLVRINGDVGNFAGGALESARVGMCGGELIVNGSAGDLAGYRMRRGLLVIGGSCGRGLGTNMRAGTIIIGGRTEGAIGSGMNRGTIVLGEPTTEAHLAFRPAFTGNQIAMRLLLKRLKTLDVNVSNLEMTYQLLSGDLTSVGKGELLTRP